MRRLSVIALSPGSVSLPTCLWISFVRSIHFSIYYDDLHHTPIGRERYEYPRIRYLV